MPEDNGAEATKPAEQSDLEKIGAIIAAARIALLTTVTAEGALVSRPLAAQATDEPFDGTLWFFSEDPSPKTEEIAANPQVNAAFESGKGYLSVAGTATVVHDQARIDELWSAQASAWFTGGREDPAVALIRVDAQSAELWSTDDPKPLVLLKVAKAALTGGRPDVGETKTVAL